MIVIKLGGSLLVSGWLLQCLDKIEGEYQGRGVIIVPGGGVFANQVRQLQQEFNFDDITAHHMAILAMQQMALLISGLKPNFATIKSIVQISTAFDQHNVLIWSPDVTELDKAGIPSSWDITSDSLSAWLAKIVLAEELVLIKSAQIEENTGLEKLIDTQIVDKAFCQYSQESVFKLTIINAKQFICRCQ